MSTAMRSLSATLFRPRAIPECRRAALRVATRGVCRALLAVCLFLIAAVAGLGLYAYAHADRIYEGIAVAGVPVGGMTEAAARSKLDQEYGRYLGTSMTLVAGSQAFALTPAAAGVRLDTDATVRAAFGFGRSGSIWSRSRAWVRAIILGQTLTASLNVDQERLDGQLMAFAPALVRPPSDAYVKMDAAGEPTIVPETSGVAFDVGATRTRMLDRLGRRSSDPVPLATPRLAAVVVAKDLEASLPGARAAVAASLVLSGLGQHWAVSADDLKRIVTVPAGGGEIQVNRAAVETLVKGVAARIAHPSVDAAVKVDDKGAIRVVPSSLSVAVDTGLTVDAIVTALTGGHHAVGLVIHQSAPAISDKQADDAAAQAEQLVANGLTLQWKGGSAQLGRGDLVRALTIDPRPGEANAFVLGFDRGVLAQLLGPVGDKINVPARDARFRLVKGQITLVSDAQSGQRIGVDRTVDAMEKALRAKQGSAALTVGRVKPTYTASALKNIKLPDELAESSTYYGPSSAARRHNVERVSQLQAGWLVPPGGQFSYNEHIGKVTKDNGFVTGFGIVASQDGGVTTAPVVGGGICQVSTTIFQAGFWAGLRVDERFEHPYWIQTYGEPPRGMKGLDAMVNIDDSGSLDMKLTNTTGNWIAIDVVADGQNVTSKILGTNPGWRVSVDDPLISAVIPADGETYYTESSELPKGQEMQVEHAQEGFSTRVHRVVSKDGQVIDDYVLDSTYAPSRNTILRGTG